MDYNKKFISIEQLKVRIAELVSLGREDEPQEADFTNRSEDEWDQAHDEYNELKALRSIENDLSYCWGENSTILINSTFWVDHCEEFAYDIGAIHKHGGVAQFVDWDRYATHMLVDYRPVWIGGETFYVRN